ncbi:beta-N-acetylhexosaminidase [Lysinibacter cavernae]|uniref:Beta-N-acetylhexosaminidase n=1 Tax=Lysinibacter cavernae TaxID=1640652 RepID=A0A7X5R1C5_9MICO|nr:beta-N-acetylhexosaminidase [Lysinibacter cavernae]NIH53838.1 beta-N-acetylhexosaminidase [Lysinibacter cavernae]
MSPSPAGELARAISTTMLPGFEGHTLPEWVARRLREGMGGVCLFSTNIGSPEQVRQLTSDILAANPDAVIAIDEEGGDVTRLHHEVGSPYPGNGILGRIDDLELTRRVAEGVGAELHAVGCTMTFAPDADINSNPNNPVIGTRSFGTDAGRVARHTAAWVEGIQAAGIAASTKHFPGHGDTANDSHLSLPVIDRSIDELRERELEPFRAAIAAGTKSIMTSHILMPQIDPELPATLSPTILQVLLRGELGYDGVIVSDALDMAGASALTGIPEAAVRAISAGCDLLCIGTANTDEQMGEIIAHVADAVATGRLEDHRVLDAAERVLGLAEWKRTASTSRQSPAAVAAMLAEPKLREDVRASFSVREGVKLPVMSDGAETHLIVIESVPNAAVGHLPWGPQAERHAVGPGAVWPNLTEHLVFDCDAEQLLAGIPSDDNVIIVGQNHHRSELNRKIIDTFRARNADTLVVDMAWPSPDREYADVATFGASRLAGRALIDLLSQPGTPTGDAR